MENNFFNTQKYLEMIKIKDEYTLKVEELSKNINDMVVTVNKEIGETLKSKLMENFFIEDLKFLRLFSQHPFIGKYDELHQKITYQINITDYIIDKYVDEFKGQGKVHRGANYSIYLKFKYHLIKNNLAVELNSNGMYQLIRDNTLRESNSIMLNEANSLFEDRSIFLHELSNKLSEMKRILDNWEGYYVTLKIKEN